LDYLQASTVEEGHLVSESGGVYFNNEPDGNHPEDDAEVGAEKDTQNSVEMSGPSEHHGKKNAGVDGTAQSVLTDNVTQDFRDYRFGSYRHGNWTEHIPNEDWSAFIPTRGLKVKILAAEIIFRIRRQPRADLVPQFRRVMAKASRRLPVVDLRSRRAFCRTQSSTARQSDARDAVTRLRQNPVPSHSLLMPSHRSRRYPSSAEGTMV
jgi:hypothetical protein